MQHSYAENVIKIRLNGEKTFLFAAMGFNACRYGSVPASLLILILYINEKIMFYVSNVMLIKHALHCQRSVLRLLLDKMFEIHFFFFWQLVQINLVQGMDKGEMQT